MERHPLQLIAPPLPPLALLPTKREVDTVGWLNISKKAAPPLRPETQLVNELSVRRAPVPWVCSAPPLDGATLAWKVQLSNSSCRSPATRTAPPYAVSLGPTELLMKLLEAIRAAAKSSARAPPAVPAEQLLNTLSLITREPPVAMPPPPKPVAVLESMVTPVNDMVAKAPATAPPSPSMWLSARLQCSSCSAESLTWIAPEEL